MTDGCGRTVAMKFNSLYYYYYLFELSLCKEFCKIDRQNISICKDLFVSIWSHVVLHITSPNLQVK